MIEDSIRLESFELTLGDIAEVELEKLHALSIGVGWPHRREDWQMLREVGKGIVASDEIGRVLGSAMWFPFGADFAMIGMVITSPRLQTQGAGRWLMANVLAQTGTRALGLNATRAAHRLYLSLGFKDERIVYQCQGLARTPEPEPPSSGATLREVGPADLTEIAAMDRGAYGADRSPLLARLLEVSKGLALVRGQRIQAFALCRRFGRGHVVGPVIAANDADAIAVTSPHVADHARHFLRLDTRQAAGAFPEFLARSGLPVYDTVTSMSLGRPWTTGVGSSSERRPTIYGLISQAIG